MHKSAVSITTLAAAALMTVISAGLLSLTPAEAYMTQREVEERLQEQKKNAKLREQINLKNPALAGLATGNSRLAVRLNPQPRWDAASKVLLNPQPLPPKDRFGTVSNFGSDRMLNPQPLPPKSLAIATVSNPGSDRMLNPQPLPPKDRFGAVSNFGSDRMLNPQPLPPKSLAIATVSNPGSDRMLNPQPLPPKPALFTTASSAASARMLNPQPLPPVNDRFRVR